jgi:hypothetical protein
MGVPGRRSGVPDERERVLLRVCFLPPGAAGREWDEHGSRVRLEELPAESHGLLPLLHRRLVELGRTPASLDLLHGVRRRLWVQNQLRFSAVGDVVDALDGAGVRSALVGGAGVLAGHLGLDLRPIHDVDVLVAAGDAVDARAALVGRGWTPTSSWRDGFALDVDATRFVAGDRSIVVRRSQSRPYDDAIDRAGRVALGGGAVPVAEPADLLLHTLIDGARMLRGARTRWASDSLVVLTTAAPDWERFVTAANARHAGPSVARALELLHGIAPFPHGPDIFSRLAAETRQPWQQVLGCDAAGPTTVLRAHARRSSGIGACRAAMTLPAYVREAWSAPWTRPRVEILE